MESHPFVVVIPILEDSESAGRLFQDRASIYLNDIVDDGSVKNPFDPSSIAVEGLKGAVIKLKLNLGHHLNK